jgi:CheY-like chemotaxis protein
VKRTVWVVDDEKLVADTVAMILEGNGFNAVAMYSGNSALQQLINGCPDVLLSDVVMPKMNGIETAIGITQRCPGVKVFLFSGQAATGDLLSDAEDRGYHFELLLKPLRPEILLQKLSIH